MGKVSLMAKQTKRTPGTKKLTSVEIFYDESPQYRTIYSDGAWVALTPNMELQIAFFKNLTPSPEYVRQVVTSDGVFGEELEKVVKKGISREFEATVVMNREIAGVLIDLLRKTLEHADSFEKSQRSNKKS